MVVSLGSRDLCVENSIDAGKTEIIDIAVLTAPD